MTNNDEWSLLNFGEGPKPEARCGAKFCRDEIIFLSKFRETQGRHEVNEKTIFSSIFLNGHCDFDHYHFPQKWSIVYFVVFFRKTVTP